MRGVHREYVGHTGAKGYTRGIMWCTLRVLQRVDRECKTSYAGHTRSTWGVRGLVGTLILSMYPI